MFTYSEAEKLKRDCEIALNTAGHRNKNKNTGKRKQRNDTSLVVWQRTQEKLAKHLGYSNYEQWQDLRGLSEDL